MDNTNTKDIVICPNCKAKMIRTELIGICRTTNTPKYADTCPYCGADMREES